MMIDPEMVINKIDHKKWAGRIYSFDWSYQRSDDYSVYVRGEGAYRKILEDASNQIWSPEDEIKIIDLIKEIHMEFFKSEIKEDFYNYLITRVHFLAERGRKNASKD